MPLPIACSVSPAADELWYSGICVTVFSKGGTSARQITLATQLLLIDILSITCWDVSTVKGIFQGRFLSWVDSVKPTTAEAESDFSSKDELLPGGKTEPNWLQTRPKKLAMVHGMSP